MRTSKSIIAAVLCTIATIVVLSAIVLGCYFESESDMFQDAKYRRDLAGSINLFVSGASQSMNAFDPRILDDRLGCQSYNMSGVLFTLNARRILLEKELSRNPVDTVVLEVAYDTLSRAQDEDHHRCDFLMLAKLETFGERWNYLTTYMDFDGIVSSGQRGLVNGINAFKNFLRRQEGELDRATKGFYEAASEDIRLNPDEVVSLRDSKFADATVREENWQQLNEVFDLLDGYGVRVVVVLVPLSDGMVWQYSNMDEAMKPFKEICATRGYEYYDFNLLKAKKYQMSDAESFYDENHMSKEGAAVFSNLFCDVIMKHKAGESVDDLFYASYEEVKQDSVYADGL